MNPLKVWQTAMPDEGPTCLVCSVRTPSQGDLFCSATCVDIWQWRETLPSLSEQMGTDEQEWA